MNNLKEWVILSLATIALPLLWRYLPNIWSHYKACFNALIISLLEKTKSYWSGHASEVKAGIEEIASEIKADVDKVDQEPK